MHSTESRPSCADCPVEGCRQNMEEARGSGMSGWRFAGASAAVFLFPLFLACLGAVMGRSNPGWQAAGAVSGLLAGMGLSVFTYRLQRRVSNRS